MTRQWVKCLFLISVLLLAAACDRPIELPGLPTDIKRDTIPERVRALSLDLGIDRPIDVIYLEPSSVDNKRIYKIGLAGDSWIEITPDNGELHSYECPAYGDAPADALLAPSDILAIAVKFLKKHGGSDRREDYEAKFVECKPDQGKAYDEWVVRSVRDANNRPVQPWNGKLRIMARSGGIVEFMCAPERKQVTLEDLTLLEEKINGPHDKRGAKNEGISKKSEGESPAVENGKQELEKGIR